MINIWVPRGKPLVTPKRLLGPEFFGELEDRQFKTKEEWEKHKRDLTRMARRHSKTLRAMRAGTAKKEEVSVGDIMKRHVK